MEYNVTTFWYLDSHRRNVEDRLNKLRNMWQFGKKMLLLLLGGGRVLLILRTWMGKILQHQDCRSGFGSSHLWTVLLSKNKLFLLSLRIIWGFTKGLTKFGQSHAGIKISMAKKTWIKRILAFHCFIVLSNLFHWPILWDLDNQQCSSYTSQMWIIP